MANTKHLRMMFPAYLRNLETKVIEQKPQVRAEGRLGMLPRASVYWLVWWTLLQFLVKST